MGWHIDPFGHTTGTAFLFSKMGFNMFQFGRSPQGVNLPSAPDGNQFVWRPMQSIKTNAVQDLWTYYHKGYGGGAPGSCDKGCSDKDMQGYAASKKRDLADRASCPVTLDMYGHDFAVADWPGADNVVKYFADHPELNVTAKYSTPSVFYKAMNECGRDWEVFQPPDNDFFPYWTGFFSSQQVFKRMVRAASALFQTTRVIHALAAPPGTEGIAMAKKLNVLWQAVGVTQHHDGVTGTSPPATYVDYRMRLNFGSDQAASVAAGLLNGHALCLERPACANHTRLYVSPTPAPLVQCRSSARLAARRAPTTRGCA